jgi:hypothetical protein
MSRSIERQADDAAGAFLRQLGIVVAAIGFAWLAGTAALLIVRRLAGALSAPSIGWALAVLVTALAAALCAQSVVDRQRVNSRPLAWLLRGAAVVLLAATLLAISWPVQMGWPLVLALWAAAILAEAAYLRFGRSIPLWLQAGFRPRWQAKAAPPAENRISDLLADDVRQQIVRVAKADSEELRATLVESLEPSQQNAYSHLAFCPPFDRTPTVEFAQRSGPPARIRIGQLLASGVRLDIKLATPTDSPTKVTIQLIATAAKEHTSATSGEDL